MLSVQRYALGLGLLAMLVSGCGDPGEPVMPEHPPHATCTVTPGPEIPTTTLQSIHDASRLAGQRTGRKRAEAYVTQRTDDGYRLRRFVTLGLMGLGLLMVGGLAGTLLLSLFSRRPTLRYANVLGEQTDRELTAIRGLPDVVAAPLGPVVAALERRGQLLVDECAPLQEGCDTVSEERRLEALYAELDTYVSAVELLRIEATSWSEQIARGGKDEKHARTALARRVAGQKQSKASKASAAAEAT